MDWECECHEQAWNAFGYLTNYQYGTVPGICPGPAAIEMIIDGHSFTLIRSWDAPCEDYSMETTDGSLSDYEGITPHDSPDMDALVATYGKVWVIPTENEWYKAAYYDGKASHAGSTRSCG